MNGARLLKRTLPSSRPSQDEVSTDVGMITMKEGLNNLLPRCARCTGGTGSRPRIPYFRVQLLWFSHVTEVTACVVSSVVVDGSTAVDGCNRCGRVLYTVHDVDAGVCARLTPHQQSKNRNAAGMYLSPRPFPSSLTNDCHDDPPTETMRVLAGHPAAPRHGRHQTQQRRPLHPLAQPQRAPLRPIDCSPGDSPFVCSG